MDDEERRRAAIARIDAALRKKGVVTDDAARSPGRDMAPARSAVHHPNAAGSSCQGRPHAPLAVHGEAATRATPARNQFNHLVLDVLDQITLAWKAHDKAIRALQSRVSPQLDEAGIGNADTRFYNSEIDETDIEAFKDRIARIDQKWIAMTFGLNQPSGGETLPDSND